MPNLFDIYFKNLKTLPPLTNEREKELFEFEGENMPDAAFTELVSGNLRFVVKIAKEYSVAWPTFDIMDLIQEGNICLMKAITKFDVKKGFKLSTFVDPWIRGGIKRYIHQNQSAIKVTKTAAHEKMFYKLNKERTALEAKGLPTDTKVMAKQLNVNEQDLREVEPLLFEDGVLSLSNNNDLGLLDEDDPETLVLKKEREVRIVKLIKKFGTTLTKPQRLVFENRMISDEPLTQEELAKITMTTQQSISKIEHNIMCNALKFFPKDDIKDILTNG